MYPEIPVVESDADLAKIVATFVETGLRRLIVTDYEDRPIGLILDSDVISRIQLPERRERKTMGLVDRQILLKALAAG